jgi:hypothetical protein
MKRLSRATGTRLAVLVVLAGSAAVLPAAAAKAAGCGTPTGAGVSCAATGTLTWTSGVLNLVSPTDLSWTGTANGLDQHVVDTEPEDQAFTVSDATGTGTGWHITVSATTFTSGANTLLNAGTFSLNGSTNSQTTTTVPPATCSGGSTCTLPIDTTVYPVAITTAATGPVAVTIYNANAPSGLGSININPVGWWLNIPGTVPGGSYTSTITVEILATP